MKKHPQSKTPLEVWHFDTKKLNGKHLMILKKVYSNASFLEDNRVVLILKVMIID